MISVLARSRECPKKGLATLQDERDQTKPIHSIDHADPLLMDALIGERVRLTVNWVVVRSAKRRAPSAQSARWPAQLSVLLNVVR
jgi:hypothetical protein